MGIQKHSVTILNGATESSSLRVGTDQAIVRLDVPAMTSASLSFKVSEDNLTFIPLREDDGTLYSVTISGASAIQIPTEKIMAPNYLKIIGASSEASERTIQVYHLEV